MFLAIVFSIMQWLSSDTGGEISAQWSYLVRGNLNRCIAANNEMYNISQSLFQNELVVRLVPSAEQKRQ